MNLIIANRNHENYSGPATMGRSPETRGIDVAAGIPKTCGTCKHFQPGAIDPLNVQPAEKRLGECQEGYHLIALPTQHGMQITTMFARLPPEATACSKWQPNMGELT